jgi:hypothetical protein
MEIVNIIIELEKIFNLLNKEFFENKLIKPFIIISNDKKNVLGSCSNDPIWIDKNNKDNNKYEIALNGKRLNRSLEEITSTMLHEMVHLYCSVNNINDTSSNWSYHNKFFKTEAEKRGLTVSRNEIRGWATTRLNDNTKKLISEFEIDKSVFNFYRE